MMMNNEFSKDQNEIEGSKDATIEDNGFYFPIYIFGMREKKYSYDFIFKYGSQGLSKLRISVCGRKNIIMEFGVQNAVHQNLVYILA